MHSGEKNTNCDYFMSVCEVDYKLSNSQLVRDLGVPGGALVSSLVLQSVGSGFESSGGRSGL